MKSKRIFSKILCVLSSVVLGISTTSVCGMGMEEMPESIKKSR